jgi:hypothetical protein
MLVGTTGPPEFGVVMILILVSFSAKFLRTFDVESFEPSSIIMSSKSENV